MAMALERRLWGAAMVLAAAVITVAAVRRVDQPTAENSPAYRQKGELSARVVITEFSDFQCPACRVAEPAVRNLLSLYDGKVRFIFKHFPIDRLHPWARSGAAAAECAGRQGKFWPYHDLLYDRQQEWVSAKNPPDQLSQFAKELGLDQAAFAACLRDPSLAAVVEADKKGGDNRWVGSTPTFFINRKRFAGAQQFASLGTIWIDKILRK